MKRNSLRANHISIIPLRLGALAIFAGSFGAANAGVLTSNYTGAFNDPILNSAVLGTYTPVASFMAGGNPYNINDSPVTPTFEATPSASFLTILNGQQSSLVANGVNLTFGQLYTFNTGKALANNDLVLRSYAANASGGTVDDDFYIENAGATISGGKVHWIQTLVDNWKLNSPVGTLDSKVDNSPLKANPYYDNGGDANSTFLSDDPTRQTAGYNGLPIYFNFETFLVNENSSYTLNDDGTVKTKGSVDVYGGVLWGFTITPEPGTTALLVLAGPVCWVLRRRIRAKAGGV